MHAIRPAAANGWIVPVLAIGVLAGGCSRATFHGIEDAQSVCDAANRALWVLPDHPLGVQPDRPAEVAWSLDDHQSYRVYCDVTPARNGTCRVWLRAEKVDPDGASTRQEDYERFLFRVMADMLAESTAGAPPPTQTHNQRTTTIVPVRVRRDGKGLRADFPDESPARLIGRLHKVNPALVWSYGQFGAVRTTPMPWGLGLTISSPGDSGSTQSARQPVAIRVESADPKARIVVEHGDAVRRMALLRNLMRWLETHPALQARVPAGSPPARMGPRQGTRTPQHPGTPASPSEAPGQDDLVADPGGEGRSDDPATKPDAPPTTQPAGADRPDWRVGPPPPPQPDFE